MHKFGFVAKEYISLGEKLLNSRERFDRVIQDKKIEGREKYMTALKTLVKQLHAVHEKSHKVYSKMFDAKSALAKSKVLKELSKQQDAAEKLFVKFFFKQKVLEEFIAVADNMHRQLQEKVRSWSRSISLNLEAASRRAAKNTQRGDRRD